MRPTTKFRFWANTDLNSQFIVKDQHLNQTQHFVVIKKNTKEQCSWNSDYTQLYREREILTAMSPRAFFETEAAIKASSFRI